MSHPPLDLHTSEFLPGLTVIEASAGTGKTYSISHLVPRMLIEGTLPDLSQLLLVTFTKDAARELADRVRQVLTTLASSACSDPGIETKDIARLRKRLEADGLAQARVRQAMANLDQLAVSTIHAFCQRSLQQEGTLCGLPVLPEVMTDDAEFRTQVLETAWIERLGRDPLMAAIATGLEWSLDDTASVFRELRRAPTPRCMPVPRDLSGIRSEVEQLILNRPDVKAWSELEQLVRGVPKWNQGGPSDFADAMRRFQPLQTLPAEDSVFWHALSDVLSIWKKLPKRNLPQFGSNTWYQWTHRLGSLAEELEWSWQHHIALEAIDKVALLLQEHRLITQDGLVGALHDALHRVGADGVATPGADLLATRLANRYRVALVDESQDTDPRQMAIFSRIFLRPEQPRLLILVGDPKQAIYGFRGADLGTYLAAREMAQRGFTLNRTFRSPQPLVDAVNLLFAGDRPFLNEGIRFEPATSGIEGDRQLSTPGGRQSRIEFWLLPSDGPGSLQKKAHRIRGLSEAVASVVTRLLRDRAVLQEVSPNGIVSSEPVTPADIAVLVATNAQADAMAEAFQQVGVPVVINSGADVFDTDEARDLLLLLQAILDPRRKTRLRAALATRLIGLDARHIAGLVTSEGGAEGGATVEATAWLDLFNRWKDLWLADGFASLVAAMDQPSEGTMGVGITHRLARIPMTGERRATNHRHLTDLLLQAGRHEATQPETLVRWLAQQIARSETRASIEERQLQISTDRKAVQILTMHACKGLEYPLVFCPYLAEPLFDKQDIERLRGQWDQELGSRIDLLLKTKMFDEATSERFTWLLANAQLEERLRLAYVALTRAGVRLWTASYTTSNRGRSGIRVSALDWLLGSPRPDACSKDFVERINTHRTMRHLAALQAMGARPQGEAGPMEPPLITHAPLPEPDTDRTPILDTDPKVDPRPAAPLPVLPRPWLVTSFSTLTREKSPHADRLSRPGGDPGRPSAEATASGSGSPFFGAPGGSAVGSVVHAWLERWDFGAVDRVSIEALVRSFPSLPEVPDGVRPWGDQLVDLFTALREVHLPEAGGLPLSQLCPDPHASEWRFHLPLREDLSIGDLIECFERHARPEHRDYVARLRDLPASTTQGFLQGFIDRLFRHGDQWGVIDWKTNLLGRSPGDYDEAGMLACAMDSHYLLQCHLYLVALRRHLRSLGLPTTCANQAWLVFLRAIRPGTDRGVLRIHPTETLLESLDTLFAPSST
jgi:exodeoxyribonuclease V beta subunit